VTHLPLCTFGILLMCGCPGVVTSANPSFASADAATAPYAPLIPADAFIQLKDYPGAIEDQCTNDGLHPNFPDDSDRITKVFCQQIKDGGVAVSIHSLADLQQALGLGFINTSAGNGMGGNPAFTLNGQSSSLVTHSVSAINPRAFIFTPVQPDGGLPADFTFLTFTRGEQFVEALVNDPTLNQINMYLVRFDQTCTASSTGCASGDLLSPKLETGWYDARPYDSQQTALNDTIADCNQCHDPFNTGNLFLRMPENTAPYTHFFSQLTPGGRALLQDYHSAHGYDEDYGPIPAALIDQSDPSLLAAAVAAAGFGQQPNAFDSAQIEAEVEASAPEQPAVNVPPGFSPIWQATYDLALAGEFIAVPYHDVKVTDSSKLASATAAYQAASSGQSPWSGLPDITDVFLDSALPELNFAPRPGSTGLEMLTQLCHECHNSNLDQTLSRARFNVDTLDCLSPSEMNVAVARIGLGDDTGFRMPPRLFRSLSEDEKVLIVDALQSTGAAYGTAACANPNASEADSGSGVDSGAPLDSGPQPVDAGVTDSGGFGPSDGG
jgi:hypothetical protein